MGDAWVSRERALMGDAWVSRESVGERGCPERAQRERDDSATRHDPLSQLCEATSVPAGLAGDDLRAASSRAGIAISSVRLPAMMNADVK
jgi:hypothetical protein